MACGNRVKKAKNKKHNKAAVVRLEPALAGKKKLKDFRVQQKGEARQLAELGVLASE